MTQKKNRQLQPTASLVSPEVAERIRTEHILLRDEAKVVSALAKREGNRELAAHALSLERLVKSHVLLVEGVLDAVVPDNTF